MAKYKDRSKYANSKLLPRIRGEPYQARHLRRKEKNQENAHEVREFCKKNKLNFRILNGGHHWQVTKVSTQIDWWPSTAKLVINRKWWKGIHLYDHKQFIEYLKNYFHIGE